MSVLIDNALIERARRLFARLAWIGLAELQFLQDADGRLYLIDLNGRFYGSMALAISAGASLPAVWAADAIGLRPEPQFARPGRRYQWLEGDLRLAWAGRVATRRCGQASATLRALPIASFAEETSAPPLTALARASGGREAVLKPEWAVTVSNRRPLGCKPSALPLS